ncbi:hypothetical protein DNTS_000506 [Danionella cerebrum]|uniref:Uncharacterized protein n=1 Tax=Danionella cerebrum TaxID=2873325 RepID=A0A553RMT1_9TELE|nr:hypothetical protein DNTS_000506 [Danionella translucida]
MEEHPDSHRQIKRSSDDQKREEESPLVDNDLPIMHWEDLSFRIAELERQEEERRKKAEITPTGAMERGERLSFNSHKNLQLCFVNNSESEEEDEEGASSKESSCEVEERGSCSAGLKQEVKIALRALRDKLWAEQKEKQKEPDGHSKMNIRRKILSLSDLETCSLLQLNSLRLSLTEDIQDLSSELVKHLVIRDHFRNKQDALLLDVQDMTSL